MSSRAPQLKLWTLRLYYFMLIGGGGFLFPFINLFYTQQGLSGTEIGLLSTFASLAALIAAPWWGRRSDASSHPRRLLQFGLLATSLCLLAFSGNTLCRACSLRAMPLLRGDGDGGGVSDVNVCCFPLSYVKSNANGRYFCCAARGALDAQCSAPLAGLWRPYLHWAPNSVASTLPQPSCASKAHCDVAGRAYILRFDGSSDDPSVAGLAHCALQGISAPS